MHREPRRPDRDDRDRDDYEGRRDRRDFGQADYSHEYVYDPEHRRGVRADEADHDRGPRRAGGVRREIRPRDDFVRTDYREDFDYQPRDTYRRREPEPRYGDFAPRRGGPGGPAVFGGRPPRSAQAAPIPYRGREPERREHREPRRDAQDEDRSWFDRAGEEVSSWFGRDERREARDLRRDEEQRAEDRRIWAAITGRLQDERRLDVSDLDVRVEDGIVTLTGSVPDRDDKRRAEDLAEVRGVRDVQNHLRLRESDRRRWL